MANKIGNWNQSNRINFLKMFYSDPTIPRKLLIKCQPNSHCPVSLVSSVSKSFYAFWYFILILFWDLNSLEVPGIPQKASKSSWQSPFHRSHFSQVGAKFKPLIKRLPSKSQLPFCGHFIATLANGHINYPPSNIWCWLLTGNFHKSYDFNFKTELSSVAHI